MDDDDHGGVKDKGGKRGRGARPKPPTSLHSGGSYRVTMVVAHLCWVDFDLGCSILLLGSR